MDPEKVNDHYCDHLPAAPLPENKTILVTGARGYVARRMIPERVSRGYFFRPLLRKKYAQPPLNHPRIEYVYADRLVEVKA